MSCKCAVRTDEFHGWACTVTDGACMFFHPDSKACAETYGEGPDAHNASTEKETVTQETSEEFWARLGKCLGYASEKCPKCGRVRLEKYESGDIICEKCGWNNTTQKYEPDRY